MVVAVAVIASVASSVSEKRMPLLLLLSAAAVGGGEDVLGSVGVAVVAAAATAVRIGEVDSRPRMNSLSVLMLEDVCLAGETSSFSSCSSKYERTEKEQRQQQQNQRKHCGSEDAACIDGRGSSAPLKRLGQSNGQHKHHGRGGLLETRTTST